MGNISDILQSLEYITSYMPGSFYWKDLQGKYLGCNNYYLVRHPAFTRETLIGKTDFEIWPSKSQAEALVRHDQYVIQTGVPLEIEEKITFPGGSGIKYFATVKMPLKDKDNKVCGLIGNSLDITEQKRSQQALQKTKLQIESAKTALQTKSDFIVNISHDFKTPLHSIIGMTQSLLLQKNLPHQQELLQSISNSANLMLEFTQEILDISALGGDLISLHQEEFDLQKLFNSLVNMISHDAKNKKIEVISKYSCDLPTLVSGDLKIIRRIILNMLEYALRNNSGDSIEVYISKGAMLENSEKTTMAVQFGISGTNLEVQQNNNNLGITIIKQLVSLHGGTIDFTAEALSCELQLTVTNNMVEI